MSVLFKQAVAVIDRRTTNVCLAVAGQIVGIEADFDTLNGSFYAPPFHIHCRTTVSPYMAGFVNEQRAASNAELQQRPRASRDTRGAKTPPPDRNNPPSKGGPRRSEPKTPPPTPRGRALDIAESRRANTTAAQARATRERLSRESAGHRATVAAVTKTLRGQNVPSAQARALRETVRAAPVTKTTMWHALPGVSPLGFKIGGTVANPDVTVFTATRTLAERSLPTGGVLVVLRGGRALPVESIAPSPSRKEWLVGRTLRIVGIREGARGVTIVEVETE